MALRFARLARLARLTGGLALGSGLIQGIIQGIRSPLLTVFWAKA
jgi:hypothetical protein